MTAIPEPSNELFVVGIGASAGGLDPIEKFFDNVPCDTGMAFVIVQHLSPDFKSLMDELLARHTDMPIHLVEDGMVVEANHVYLIPSKKEMIISGGRLLLSDRAREKELTLPIDVFFRSLAQDCGSRAVAIVLSGGGSDGSRGIRDIREAGGLVIVQDTDSAQFDGMPKTARDAGVAQWVLAPQDMPRVLLEHRERPAPASPHGSDAPALAAVYAMLRAEFGLDFTLYKPTTVTRRIERRLALASTPNIEEYLERLKRDRGELDVLYRDLLIGVTRFFRDPQAFEVLERRVLPQLLDRAAPDSPLRIWVAGCATGEEAYSFAIVLSDLMAKVGERPVKIFASDVHRGSLEHATRGIYPADAVANVTPERLERYFLRVGDSYQVVPDLRQMVVFAAHDVIKAAPFTRVDLISCRNMLIYLQPSAQQKVLSLFHFGLNRGGVLVLGPSESPGGLANDFETLDKHWKIYRKQSDVRIPVDMGRHRIAYGEPSVALPVAMPSVSRQSIGQLLSTYDAILDDVMPPSFLLTEQGELVHSFGGASRFLRPRDGRQGLDILDAVAGELRVVLMGGMKRASAEPSAIVFKGVRIESSGKAGTYKVTLRRVTHKKQGAVHVLVSFEPMEPGPASQTIHEKEIDLDQVSREQLARLETELGHTKENLQAAIEELQSTNEELQASNEELQASNEELQSTNEELQSVNEELYTVNAEYQRKISELTELTNDMDNLMAATEIGTVFLGQDLTIRKFTPRIAEIFSLMTQDVGRSIETFAHKMEHPELVDDMKRVVATGAPVERALRDVGGKSLFMRILPYRARGKSEGVVLTVIDVSGLRAAEDALFHERYLLNSLMHGVPDAIYFKDTNARFIRANRAMAVRLGLNDPKDAEGKTALEMPNRDAALLLHRQDDGVLRTGQAQHYQLETRTGADGAECWDLTTRIPLWDANKQVVGIIVISRNVTDQKRAEARAAEAVRRRDQFLAMLSHELRNPLGAIVSATDLLQKTGLDATSTRRSLDVMTRQSQQMARLLDDLLEVSRVTQNKIELRTESLAIDALAKETANAFRQKFKAAGLDFALRIDADDLRVHADPTRLQQILANLLGNAAKYTPSGGRVTLSVAAHEGEAVITVGDTGAGIPRQMLESVFDLFVQAGETLDRAAGGIGVGLTLVRSLVMMHGGTVTAYSAGEGKGSEFVVRLPLAKAEPEKEETMQETTSRVRVRLPAGARIVIVEDNTDGREMLSEILGSAGYECHTAADGATGLALIDAVDPSVAILDIGLPTMDGYEVARRIREDARHSGIWLIALTGYGQAADRRATHEAGFDEHIVKPVQVEQILGRLAEMQSPGSLSQGRGVLAAS